MLLVIFNGYVYFGGQFRQSDKLEFINFFVSMWYIGHQLELLNYFVI